MRLEELIKDAIENEKKIDFDDCTSYALKDKKGDLHFALYNENLVLTMVRGRYKLIIGDPSEIKINLLGHTKEYKEMVNKMNYRKALRFVGTKSIEIPGKFGEIFNYLKNKYPIEISGKRYLGPSLKKVRRIYDEIKMVKDLKRKAKGLKKKDLKKRGLDDRSIAMKVYEKFEDKGISHGDFQDYKFSTLSKYIQGINYLKKHQGLEENIKEWKKEKLDDREIARRIYDEKNHIGLESTLMFLNENTLSQYIRGINYLKKHQGLEENIKEWKKEKLDDRKIAKMIYDEKNRHGLVFALEFLNENTLSNYIQGINYLKKHQGLEEKLKKWKGKKDNREIARRIYDEKNWHGLRSALEFLNENTLSNYIRGINYLEKHPKLKEKLKKWKEKINDREIARRIYDEKNWEGLRFALEFLGENKIVYQIEKLHKEKANS